MAQTNKQIKKELNMFTMRFMQDEPQKQIVVECARYDVDLKEGGYQITTYPTMTSENGVEWWLISGNGSEIDHCYITNSAGKTVDSYHLGKEPQGETEDIELNKSEI